MWTVRSCSSGDLRDFPRNFSHFILFKNIYIYSCPLRRGGAGALPAAPGDAASAAAAGEAGEPRHHASAQRPQPHTGERPPTNQDLGLVGASDQSGPSGLLGLPLILSVCPPLCSCTSATTTDGPTSTTSKRPWTCWSTSRR